MFRRWTDMRMTNLNWRWATHVVLYVNMCSQWLIKINYCLVNLFSLNNLLLQFISSWLFGRLCAFIKEHLKVKNEARGVEKCACCTAKNNALQISRDMKCELVIYSLENLSFYSWRTLKFTKACKNPQKQKLVVISLFIYGNYSYCLYANLRSNF